MSRNYVATKLATGTAVYVLGVRGKFYRTDAQGNIITGTNEDWKDRDDFLAGNTAIHQVKRSSDDELFSVGDNLSTYGKINSITIKQGGVILNTSIGSVVLAEASKAPVRMTLTEIQAELDARPAIRLEKTLRKRSETIEEFIEDFFTSYNENKATIFVESQAVQTEAGKRRSLDDIYQILKYYYPTATLLQVVRLLHVHLPANLDHFRSSECKKIKKRTYYYDEEQDGEILNKEFVDQWGYRFAEYPVK